MHLLQSIVLLGKMAFVGQASKQRVQSPQRDLIGLVGVKFSVVKMMLMKNLEPSFGWMTSPDLPLHPSPQATAQSRSSTGPVSV